MKNTLPREFYVPKGALIVRPKNCDAVVYASPDRPHATGFIGKAQKPAFNFIFRSEARRAEYVAEFFAKVAAIEKSRAARKANRTAFVHSLKVGDILSNSWGYEQTNTEFYEVLELVGKTMCVVRELACQSEQTGFLSESVVPIPGRYLERAKPMRKRILEGNVVDVHNANFGRASLYFRPEPGKLPIMAPRHVSHTH